LLSPLYCAVITFEPLAKVVVDSVATARAKKVFVFTPPVTVTAVPKLDPFSENCTVPVGSCEAFAVALLCVETVTVKVTCWPAWVDVGLAATAVVVEALPTVITPIAGALEVKLLSPK
jgi:hypothetical protein